MKTRKKVSAIVLIAFLITTAYLAYNSLKGITIEDIFSPDFGDDDEDADL